MFRTQSLSPAIHARPQRRVRRGMGLFEMLRVALGAIAANKLRSILTMLGVIIGVGDVIVMVSLGEGAAKANEAAIKNLGVNRLYIRPQEQMVRGVAQGVGSGDLLTLEDVDLLRRHSRHLIALAPETRAQGVRVEYRNANTTTEVNGSTPDIFRVRNLTIAEGRAFTNAENEQKARVAVLGHEVAQTLFGGSGGIGASILVNGRAFKVVGIQKKMGEVPFANRDDQITIPILTAMRRLFRSDRIRSISAQAASVESMRDAEEEVHRLMRKARKLAADAPSPVRVFNQADLLETASEQGAVLTMLLSGVAMVSLVVGGIGIMNIMLVTVTERTREIGIRRAIGARRSHILLQFLTEAIVLSCVGGLLGIAMGAGLTYWLGKPPAEGGMGVATWLSVSAITVSFSSAAFVGVFFGIYPAMKASALDPIEALRHE